jgi:hypothetical protein
MEDALVNVFAFAVAPIVAAVVFREEHMVKGGS